MNKIYLGVDAGGTNFRGGPVDPKTKRKTVEIKQFGAPKSLKDFLRLLKPSVDKYKPAGIGIAIAGGHDEYGVFDLSPNNPWLLGVNLEKEVFNCFGINTVITNDLTGAGRGAIEFTDPNIPTLVITWSTGINSRFIYKGVMVPGSETGHIPVSDSHFGRFCGCKKQNCVEAYAGGASVELIIEDELRRMSPEEQERLRIPGESNSKVLDTAYAAGEEWAVKHYDRIIIPALAKTLGIIHLCTPFDKIIWMGSFAKYALEIPGVTDKLCIGMQKIMAKGKATSIKHERLPDEAPVVGAALWAYDTLVD